MKKVYNDILNYAKQEVYFSHINCLIEKDNIASIALAEKLGFIFIEEMEEKGKQMLRFKRQLQIGERTKENQFLKGFAKIKYDREHKESLSNILN